MPLDFNDPTTQLIIGAGLIVLLLLLLSLRAVSRLTKAAEPLSYQMNALGQRVQALGEGQEIGGRSASRVRGTGQTTNQHVAIDGKTTGRCATANERKFARLRTSNGPFIG